jgi:hypothetical protein
MLGGGAVGSYQQGSRSDAQKYSPQSSDLTSKDRIKPKVVERYPISESEEMAYSLLILKLWTDAELNYIESINPKELRTIVKFDDQGKRNGTKKILGKELRDSIALIKAHSCKSQLEELARPKP